MSIVALALATVFSAQAASLPNLGTSITAPSGAYVYQSAKWQVKVSNTGTRDATGTTLTVQLPATNTSPTVYVMGTVDSMSSSCSRSSTTVSCSLGTVRKGKSTTVELWLTLPESAGTLDISANVTNTVGDSNSGNNASSATASLLNTSPSFTGSVDVWNRHCTGTALESFFECELFPSSISEHAATFHDDGTISFIDYPDYWGSWSVSGSELSFVYESALGTEAEFVGYGVDADCWEGLTTFPGSTYVAPYEVCL